MNIILWIYIQDLQLDTYESYGLFLCNLSISLFNIEYNKTMLNDMSVNAVIQIIC